MQTSTVFQSNNLIPFPQFTGERVYMREFTKAAGLPPDLARWQDTVDAMLDGADASGPIFLMVDQAPVKVATTHRRPGLHVDGFWHPALQAHGGGGHSSRPAGPVGGRIHDSGCHRYTPAPTTPAVPDVGRHRGRPSGHFHAGDDTEALILASDVLGCAAYVGRFDGLPVDGGDCAHIDTSGLLRVDMEPGRAWAGHTLTMLHEALPVQRDCLRTVVRLNVRAWCAV